MSRFGRPMRDRTGVRIPAQNPPVRPDFDYLHLDEDGGLLIVSAPGEPDPQAKLRL